MLFLTRKNINEHFFSLILLKKIPLQAFKQCASFSDFVTSGGRICMCIVRSLGLTRNLYLLNEFFMFSIVKTFFTNTLGCWPFKKVKTLLSGGHPKIGCPEFEVLSAIFSHVKKWSWYDRTSCHILFYLMRFIFRDSQVLWYKNFFKNSTDLLVG